MTNCLRYLRYRSEFFAQYLQRKAVRGLPLVLVEAVQHPLGGLFDELIVLRRSARPDWERVTPCTWSVATGQAHDGLRGRSGRADAERGEDGRADLFEPIANLWAAQHRNRS